jgi:F0F1-type ATP synthase membrane subunit b/b'
VRRWSFDWATFAFQLVNVLILLAILRRFLFKPIAGIIAERQAETDPEQAADQQEDRRPGACRMTAPLPVEMDE